MSRRFRCLRVVRGLALAVALVGGVLALVGSFGAQRAPKVFFVPATHAAPIATMTRLAAVHGGAGVLAAGPLARSWEGNAT